MIKEIVKTHKQEFDKDNIFLDLNNIKKDFSFLNFFLGGRGIGKTFNILRYLIDDFINNNHQFMLVRRTNAQLNATTIFSEIVNFYDGEFTVKTEDKKLTEVYYNNKLMCYLSAVSTAYNLKSQSFPNVFTIFYDEFLPTLNERMIKNEVFLFLELCESVFRLKDNTQLFLSANTVSLDNQYFNYFHIILDDITDNTVIRLDNISIFKFSTNAKYLELKNKSKFGKLVQDTEFYNYAYKNDWLSGVANINYIDATLITKVDKKNDFCLYFGGDKYYKIAKLGKYSCNTFIYTDFKKSTDTFTPYTNFITKKIQFLPYSEFIIKLHELETDFKNQLLKFDCTKTYNKFIPFITTQLKY